MLIFAGISIVFIIIVVVAVVVFLPSAAENRTVQPTSTKNVTQPGEGVSSAQTHKVQKTIHPSGTPTIRQISTQQNTSVAPVDFILLPGDQISCGLTCRQLDASITNIGYETAHNVCITVGLHNSRNEIISLNGKPALQRCIGDIAGGEKKTESIIINADCGMFATKCIGETLTLKTQVTSVEKTIRFPDQVIAV
jgi:Na+-transporting methylmalonyl-CoA/oxaloacetate decarboxylase gamma subunit